MRDCYASEVAEGNINLCSRGERADSSYADTSPPHAVSTFCILVFQVLGAMWTVDRPACIEGGFSEKLIFQALGRMSHNPPSLLILTAIGSGEELLFQLREKIYSEFHRPGFGSTNPKQSSVFPGRKVWTSSNNRRK